jgi:tRNA dimethylallyltransferase
VAQAVGATIVSADSRQIYRGFDIGTAKPSPNEQALVPHIGIDVAEPSERFSAARFADLARDAIEKRHGHGRDVLVVGGTGFYVRALVEPLFPEPELDADRRAGLAKYLATLDTATLRRWCAAIDPARSTLGRTQLLRAIEVAFLTGQRLSDLFRSDSDAPRVIPQYLVVDPGASLHDAIERRVDAMLQNGWMDEVRRLSTSIPATAPAWKATGYDTLRRYVQGGAARDLSAARSEIIAATRQYAKRQRTWFRHQLHGDMLRIDPNDSSALDWALAWWHSGEPA